MSSCSKDIINDFALTEGIHYKHHTLSYLLWIACRVMIKNSVMCIFKWDLKSLSFTLIGLLKEFHSNDLISSLCSTCNMNQPLPGVCTLNLMGFDWWTVLVHRVLCALYTILLCLALQEITNILKLLASVVHIGNISLGAINQQPNSAFVKDPQPVHCVLC